MSPNRTHSAHTSSWIFWARSAAKPISRSTSAQERRAKRPNGSAQPTTLSKERAANGHPAPWKIGYLGIGNESWACGGNMTADYYLSQLKIYSHFVRNFNPLQQDEEQMLKIAVGPGTADTHWTETIMKAWQSHE